MKVEFDLDYDEADRITVNSLKDLLGILENDLELRKAGTGMSIFDTDKDKDVKLLKKHIKAFKTILRYYAGDL